MNFYRPNSLMHINNCLIYSKNQPNEISQIELCKSMIKYDEETNQVV